MPTGTNPQALQENTPLSFSKNTALVFKRWSHKGFSAFVSMHREVRIGVVSVDISARLASKTGLSPAVVPGFASQRIADGNEEDDGFLESPPDQACWQILLDLVLWVSMPITIDESCCGRDRFSLLDVCPFFPFPDHCTLSWILGHFCPSLYCRIDIEGTVPWCFDHFSLPTSKQRAQPNHLPLTLKQS